MEQDYNTKKWSRSCPNVDCRKSSSDCGIKYVFISSVLGDDQPGSKVAPKNGAYSNAIVYYEANGAVYIYSSEGIPVETNISDAELLGEIKRLAEEKADKTEIPTKLSQLLNDTGYITRTVDDLANYYTKTVTNGLLSGKADKTELPTKLSQLLNDTGYITRTVANLTNYYTKSATNGLLSGKADKNQIPTKTSQLTNDSGYITGINNSDVINALGYTPYNSTNPDGFITNTVNDLVNYYTKSQTDTLVSPIGEWDTTTQGSTISSVIGNWQEINTTYEEYDTDIEQETSTITVPKDIVSVDYLEANGEEVSPDDYTFSGKTITFNTPLEVGSYVYVAYYGVPQSISSAVGDWSNTYLDSTITTVTKSIDDRIGNWNTSQNGQNVTTVIGAWRNKFGTTNIKDKVVSIDTELSNRYTKSEVYTKDEVYAKNEVYTKTEVNNLIPTVGNGTITFTQGGVTKGTITTNQGSNATIALDASGSELPSQTGHSGEFLTTDGTDPSWAVATKVTIRSW